MIRSLKQKECELIIKQNYVGHLAYIYLDKPFIVPITYFYTEDKIICYSGDGHKINALRNYGAVALEISEINSVDNWQSVIAHGVYEELEGGNAKAALDQFSLGIKDIILRKELRDLDFISEFSAKIENNNIPIVFIINVEELTGKIRRN